jgi:hypothetical protein
MGIKGLGLISSLSSPSTRSGMHHHRSRHRHRACGFCGKPTSSLVAPLELCGGPVDSGRAQPRRRVDQCQSSTGRHSRNCGYQQLKGSSPHVGRLESTGLWTSSPSKRPQSYPQAVDDGDELGVYGRSRADNEVTELWTTLWRRPVSLSRLVTDPVGQLSDLVVDRPALGH